MLLTGLFFFGPEYRPVPLDQTFIGVTEKQKAKAASAMNLYAYEKMRGVDTIDYEIL